MVGVSSGGRLRQLGTLFARGAIGSKTDAELLELFAGRDAADAAFEALVLRHGPDVLRACRRILADPNDAEDAFQATFLVLSRRASSGTIGRPESLGPWLRGVALRVARKARVAAARRRRHEQRANARIGVDSPGQDERVDRLRDEVDRLPDPLRAPVVLCYFEDMTYEGAARRLRVSAATIRGRLARARSLLRSRLDGAEERAPAGAPHVPPALAAATIRAAIALAPGGAGIPGISAAVAELMEGVLTMTLVTRWMTIGLTVAAFGLAAAAAAPVAGRGDDDRPSAGPAIASRPGKPAATARPGHDTGEPRPAPVLTLDEAIERLLQRNLDLRAWAFEIPMARADILTVPLRARPSIDDPGKPIPSGGTVRTVPVPADADVEKTRFDINVTYPADVSFKRAPRSSARTLAEAQFLDAVRIRIDGLYSAYVDVQEAQERLHQAKTNLAWWDGLLEKTREQAGVGTILAGDTGRIESSRRLAEMSVSEARAHLSRSKRALGSSLGFSVEESDRVEVEGLGLRGLPIPPAARLIRLALQSRPDLNALRLGVKRADADIRLAQANADLLYQPYTFAGINLPDRDGTASFATGVTAPLPVYDRNRGNIERARLNLEQSRIQLAAQEKAISKEVAERRCEYDLSVAGSRGILIALQRQKRASQEAERRFGAGEAEAADVVKARHDLEKAQREYFEFWARHRRSVLALSTAVGVRLFP